MTVATIRAPAKGGSDLSVREVENITGHAPVDGLLADMLLADDPAEREALATEVATLVGRASAGALPIITRHAIATAAARSRVPWRASFADELHHASTVAMRAHQAKRSAKALATAEAEIDEALAAGDGASAMHRLLRDILESLGRDTDLDIKNETPPLVARAGLNPAEIDYFVKVSGFGRDERETRAQIVYQAAWADRAALRRDRKQAGLSCFATYAINEKTGRAVADEDFEAAEVRRAETEHVEAVISDTSGILAAATNKAAPLGSIMMIVFEAGCRTRDYPVDGAGLIAEFARAAGNADLGPLFERTISAAWDCAGAAETEAAFSRLLEVEGIAAPFAFAPEAPAAPAETRPAPEAPSAHVEAPPPPAAVAGNEAADISIDLRPRPLAELTRPPGLVGEIVDWIEASAEFPSRSLGLAAALGRVAALAGRGFETPRQARTNVYLVCLAPSGFGKDHAPSCINALARAAEKSRFLGPARFMSSSALRNEVMAQPSMLAIQDEYGGILRQIDGPKVGIHNEMIRYDLLGFFSRAKDDYAGAAYASARAVKIHNPNLCVLGLSTPDDFWSALSSSRSQDGFLGRYILFNVDGSKPPRTKPTISVRTPPEHLIDGCNAIHRAVYGRGNLSETRDGSAPFSAEEVDISQGAHEVLEALEIKIGHAAGRADFKVAPFWTRAYEHAIKLALTVAIGVEPARPVITREVMTWGADLAWASVSALCREAENRMADNERQRSFNRVIEIVRRAGSAGLSIGKLTDKLGGTLDKRLRTELIEEAEQTGRFVSILFKPATGRPGYRYVAAEFRPDMAG